MKGGSKEGWLALVNFSSLAARVLKKAQTAILNRDKVQVPSPEMFGNCKGNLALSKSQLSPKASPF